MIICNIFLLLHCLDHKKNGDLSKNTVDSYIKESFILRGVTDNTTEFLQKTDISIDSDIYLVFVPNNVCYPCLDSLYSHFRESNVDVSAIYFIFEYAHPVTEKECYSRGFENYIANTDFDFSKFKLVSESEIPVVKYMRSNDTSYMFIYKPIYDDILGLFLDM